MILKWLVLIAIVVAVWYGFKAIGRRNKAKQVRRDREEVEQMNACSVCGTYVTSDQSDCGTTGCPYPT